MTDDEPTDDAPESTDPDVADALEATGYVEQSDDSDDAADDAEQSKVGGIMDKISALSGTGKDLDSYENDPVASVFATDDGEIPRGAKHIARGVDGLSPFAAAHPLIDIGVGFVLLKAEGQIASGGSSTDAPDGPDEDGDDSDYRGDMLT
jgi:hypothetical protein